MRVYLALVPLPESAEAVQEAALQTQTSAHTGIVAKEAPIAPE